VSQVIVTRDELQERRDRSAAQEHAIETERGFVKWHNPSSKLADLIEKAVGFAVVPIVALWALFTGIIVFAFGVLQFVFRAFGKLVGGSRDLISGRKV
jgi:hypothetical protein